MPISYVHVSASRWKFSLSSSVLSLCKNALSEWINKDTLLTSPSGPTSAKMSIKNQPVNDWCFEATAIELVVASTNSQYFLII